MNPAQRPNPPQAKFRPISILIAALAAWLAVSTLFISAVVIAGGEPIPRAVILMGLGLILLWVLTGGLLARIFRDPIRRAVLSIPGDWRVKFVLFAVLLAMVEEAITTGMTNLAPVFGVPLGKAYITASSNYLDVILGHSVIVFVPMFIAWAWLLSRWDFSPELVLLLFGVTGALAESISFGFSHLSELGMWVFVYGLMVYLPAYSIPGRALPKPAWYHCLLAVILPVVVAIPVAVITGWLHPVSIHFPPIGEP